jgi:hypothetical protein
VARSGSLVACFAPLAHRLRRVGPTGTAALVFIVGLGLAARALTGAV